MFHKKIKMKTFTTLTIAFLMSFGLFAQDYATPDTGVNWNLDSLHQDNSAAVALQNGQYILNQNLNIGENDTLNLNAGDTLKIKPGIEVLVSGVFNASGTENDSISISAQDTSNPYEGFRFEEISTVNIDYTAITYGGGLKVITPNLNLTNSRIAFHNSGSATGAAVSLSGGSPVIVQNAFIENDLPAISSGANQQVSAKILNNYLRANGQANENRPQINMGPTGADTLKIINNTIAGDRDLTKVGGISVSNFISGEVHATIIDNVIKDNRYGITVQGSNTNALIKANVIEDNDTQGQPNVGGSGISLNSSDDSQTITITDNAIRRNLWGVTIQNEGSANLGDDQDNPGQNVFSENQNSGETYALYNNTDNAISAKNNCWIEGGEVSLANAESVIFHQEDDASLGLVDFDPVSCEGLSNPVAEKTTLKVYPNPVDTKLNISSNAVIEEVKLFSITGKVVKRFQVNGKKAELQINLPSGVYLAKFETDTGEQKTERLIVE